MEVILPDNNSGRINAELIRPLLFYAASVYATKVFRISTNPCGSAL